MFDQLTTALKLAAVAATLGFAGSSMAAITVLHTYDLDGTAGSPAAGTATDSTGSLDLTKAGTFNSVTTTTAGVGVDFANSGGAVNQFAGNRYENTSDNVTLTDFNNWGFETTVSLNAMPDTANGDVHGETAVIEIGAGGNRVILQTFNDTLGGGGTPVWMIHIPGLALLTADATDGGALVVGQEQHIAAVYNGTQWELYIDGAEVNIASVHGPTSTSVGSNSLTGVRLGAAEQSGNPARGLDGQVGVARIFEFEAGQFDISDTLVPEPGSLALLGLGGLLAIRRRRA